MAEPNLPEDGTRQSPPRPPRAAKNTLSGEADRETSFVANQLPARIGQFEVKMILGEGACGRVYLALDAALGRQVAIKVPKPEGFTAEFRARFLREAQATATIHHPNVCPVYFVGTEGELPFIVMRYVSGGTLAGLLDPDQQSLTLKEKLLIAKKLAKGLAAAHAQNVIHRDLKPSNVLYDKTKGEILITDFGLARIGGQTRGTVEGAVFGTPAYMSPEQARGQVGVIGPLSDVYSLGVILYEMLTGRVPFVGTVWEIMRHHCETPPHPPSVVRPGLDKRLDALCLKAMAKNPAERYPSAAAFVDAISDFIRGSRQVEILDLPEEEPQAKPKRRSAPPPLPRGGRGDFAPRRGRGFVVVAVLMLLLVAAVATAIALKPPSAGVADTNTLRPVPPPKNKFDQAAERKAVETILELKKELESKPSAGSLQLWVADHETNKEKEVRNLADPLPAEFHVQRFEMYYVNRDIDAVLQKCLTGLHGPLKLRLTHIAYLGDESFGLLARIPQLEELYIDDLPRVTDAGFALLTEHPGLTIVYLDNMNVSSAVVGKTLGSLPAIKQLALDKPLVTDELLAGLKRATTLTDLDCTAYNSSRSSRLTRAGVESIGALKNLTKLNLAGHPIEDGWLPLLYSLPLKDIDLRNTNVTVDGRKALAKTIPNCTIKPPLPTD